MTAPPLGGRRVLLAVSGSIAAYRACEVVTTLRRLGAEVRVAMTEAATRFVSAMTFQSLSGHPVAASLWSLDAGAASEGAGHGMAHIGLSDWAEALLVAPASADVLARLALGLADDAVTATALACRAPLLLAPAMETAMWEHPATRAHVATLRGRGAVIVGPGAGRLASGHQGEGRMAEPDAVVAAVAGALGVVLGTGGVRAAREAGSAAPGPPGDAWLAGARVVVTSGGTREPIDPVRFIGNRSSGKMGRALAEEALRLGARVTLVTAAPPPPPHPGLDVVEATTAAQMHDAVRAALPGAAVLVMAAAVADYRPAETLDHKLRKRGEALRLDLVPTVDVLRSLRDDPARNGTLVVGFAAETGDVVEKARRKLEEKGVDLVVANEVGVPGVGMESDDNAVTIVGPAGIVAEVPRAPKTEVARAIFEAIRGLRSR